MVEAPAYIKNSEHHEKYNAVERRRQQTGRQLALRARETEMSRLELRNHWRALDSQFERQLSRFLSPDEVRQHMLRKSFLAEDLRNSLVAFRPSEKEFDALYSLLRNDSSLQISHQAVVGTAEGPANEALIQGLRSALGAERFTALAEALHPVRRVGQRMADRRGLDDGTADAVARISLESRRAAAGVRADTGLSEEEKKTRIAAIREKRKRDVAALGGGPKSRRDRRQSGELSVTRKPAEPGATENGGSNE